jgi:hypothetical protein
MSLFMYMRVCGCAVNIAYYKFRCDCAVRGKMSINHKDHMELIASLRQDHKHHLSPSYDTEYNLLRWLIGYDYDYAQASRQLGRHLQVSCEHDCDPRYTGCVETSSV